MPSKVRAPLGVWGRSGRAGAGVMAALAAGWWAVGFGAIGTVACPGAALAAARVQPPVEPEPGDAQPQPPDEPAQPADEKAQPESQPGAGKAADLASEESLARFQQLLARRPFHGPAFNGLVNHYVERGKLPELIAEYAGKAAALPDDVALKVVLARLHLRAGDAPGAAALLEKIERLPPAMASQMSELLVLKSEVYQKTGDNAGAERVLKEAQAGASSTSERLRLAEALADLYLRGGKKDEAAASLRALAGQFPDNYLHQKHIAGALAERGLFEAAVEQYRAMLPMVKEQVDRRCEVLRELGLALEKVGKRDDAIDAYVEAVGLLASDHWLQRDLHERIVNLYRAANRLEDLAKYCETMIARAPEQTAMRILLADVQGAMGKPDLGKQTLATAVELFPKDMTLSQKRIEFLERQGDSEGVSAEYQRAIGQNPADSELYIAYGQYLANNRQVEGARNQWRHVLATKVDDAGLAVRLGALFEAYELQDDAAEAYERAIAVAPKQPEAYAALSRLWLARGDPEKAVAVLDRMGQANPDDGSVQAARAQALRDLGKVDGALEAITRACELVPEGPQGIRYAQVRSDLLVQSGRLEEALEVRRLAIDKMTNAVQQAEAIATLVSMHASAEKLGALKEREEKRLGDKADDPVSLLLLARAADVERDFPAERKRLEAVLAADPGHETALQQLAKLQDATGDVDTAVETYTRLIQRHPARARQFYEAIVDLKLRYGDRAGAIETLERMAKNDPTSAATLSGVAEQLVRMGDPERALPYYEQALGVQADRHETRLDYGKALADAGRLDDALAAFRVVATQRTDTDRAVEALGRLHDTATQLGKLEELIDELHQQVETDPQNTLVAKALALLLVRELEYSRAMDLLDLALKHNPRDVDLALARAEVLRRLARFDEAAEAYQKVLRFPQIDRDYVLGELGKTYFESGQVDQARRLWKQVQHKLYAGSLLKNNGLLQEAITVFEEGIRLKPDEYALHRNLIEALEAAGRTPDALSAAKRLLDQDPANAWNIERLAGAYLRSGDRTGAAQVAARLFGAAVGPDKTGAPKPATAQYQSFASAMYQSASAQYGASYGYGGYGNPQSNLERGVQFFLKNGLRAELEEALNQQVAAQPDNAVLKQKAADLFMSELNKPEQALVLLRELETASFPVEHQQWLGQCSQKDYLRIREYNLIGSKPALRDVEMAALEAKGADALSRDELLELAIIRNAQGSTDRAVELLQRAVGADSEDTLALGVLTDLLVSGEKFAEAEPHARRLVEVLGKRHREMQAETIERVRRDFVRSLPLEFQLRVTEALLADIAEKWTLGQAWNWWSEGTTQATGYLRSRLTLGTICAETGRMEEARALWQGLALAHGPDVDRWTMLGDVAQLHKQEDLAYEFYQHALEAAKQLAGDALLQQVYASSAAQSSWYGEQGAINKAFSSIVEAFSKRDGLVRLYDFLRDTDQEARARRLAEQYSLGDKLKELYKARMDEAEGAFRASPDGAMRASVPYFAQACKLAELYDREGNWDEAQAVYERYLKSFPDELELLVMLGEVAEARLKTDEAIAWEKKVLDCKERLAKRAREWALRDLALTPAYPKAMGANRSDMWSWSSKWGRSRWSYGSSQGQLERWASWMRLARLHLAADNPLAAADAMQRAVSESGARRDWVVRDAAELIQQRQLTKKMLPVLRTLAVYAPSDERVQLAFAESLEAADRKDLAVEVCNRMLRRGVSDLGILAEVRRRVASLNPEAAAPETTLASLEAEVAADPANLKGRLRLAKAYYYSLNLEKAEELLAALAKEAPHLEDVHDLLVEVYTLKGDSEKVIESLKARIERLTDENKRRAARWRLVDELLSAGKTDEALAAVKDLGDPRDPRSYVRIGALLHYFGKPDEAIASLEQGNKSKSKRGGYGGGDGADFGVAQSLALRGDFAGAAEKILTAVDEQSRQQVQYGGMYGMYNNGAGSAFAVLEPVFALYPELAAEVRTRLEKRLEANASDPQALKLLMALNRSLGRPDKAEELLEKVSKEGSADQTLATEQIDLAVRRKEFEKAIALAEKFIAQVPKPQLPPGMPAQYASYAILQSPRTFMVCKLGDVYWEMGQKDKAFETYKQIIDKKVDETRLAYATICVIRERAEEARALVEEALGAQQVKPPMLLQFKALLAVLDGKNDGAFDALAEAAAPGGEEEDRYGGGGSPVGILAILAQRAGMMDRFAAFVQERIKKSPSDWQNYSTLSEAYWQAGRPADALAVLDQAGKESALAAESLRQRLGWVQATATPEELIPLYRRLIELSEKDVQSAANARNYGYGNMDPAQGDRDALAELLWEKGDREGAQKLWTARMNAQQADAHIRLGQQYLKLKAYDLAEKSFARAVELDPDNVTAHTALAEEAYCRGDRKGMLAHMHEVFLRRGGGDNSKSRSRSNQYSYNAYGYNPYGDDQQDGQDPGGKLGRWAAELAGDPEITSYLGGPEVGDRGPDYRLMLAALTGDWGTLEGLLKGRVEAGTRDPLLWKLWARAQQRKGNWAEAARALDYLRRADLTTIGSHRDKLKLVLAGKQLKEAAAGTRQAQPGAGQPQPGMPSAAYAMGGWNQFGYDDWYDDASDGTLLPSIYIKLGDYSRAERLYLLSSAGSGVETRLPQIAALMWEQKGRERALELMRLALALPSDRRGTGKSLLVQYATMMAEAGQGAAATDLLVRAYRWDSSADANSRYYYYYPGQQQEFEQYEEQEISRALHEVAARSGSLEKVLKGLAEESAGVPADPRLAKLVLSMQKQGRKWDELEKSLAAWRAARPNDMAMTLEQFHAACHLGKWDEALSLLEKARHDAPDQGDQWSAHEAFVQLMKGDVEKAVAAAAPLLEKPPTPDSGLSPMAGATVLAAAHRHDALLGYLEGRRKEADLDDGGTELLVRVLIAEKQWDRALAAVLDELWKEQSALKPTGRWYRALVRVAQGASDAGASLTVSPGRPADAAMVTLATKGPQAGVKAFEALAAQPEPTLESMRGLLLSATLAGDQDLVARTNARLLTWLEARRHNAWYTPPAPSLKRLAERALKQSGRAGTTPMALSGFAQQLQQALQSSRGGGREADIVTYDGLWRSHQRLQRAVLAAGGDGAALGALLRGQARSFQAGGSGGYDYDPYMQMRRMYSRAGYGYGGPYGQTQDDQMLQGDTAALERSVLARFGRFEALGAEYERLGARTPAEEWARRGEALAGAGKGAEARQWRRRLAAARVAALVASDTPDLGAAGRDPWRYSWYGYGSRSSQQELSTIRNALASAGSNDDDIDPETYSPVRGDADQVWELAMVDPDAEKSLQAREAEIGPGWGSTRTLQQLVAYYRARRDAAKVIELVERATDAAELLRSQNLATYLWACYRARAMDKLAAVFEKASDAGSSLATELEIARLVALRLSGKGSEADSAEKKLLDRAVRETPNTHRPEPAIVAGAQPFAQDGDEEAWSQQYYDPYGYTSYTTTSWSAFGSSYVEDYPVYTGRRGGYGGDIQDLEHAVDLARALGVRYEGTVDHEEDVTLERVRRAYQRHGLHADAVRLLDREIAEAATARDRAPLLYTKATEQQQGGQADAAHQTAGELEKTLLAELKQSPAAADLRWTLTNLYMSKAYGRDYGKAYEAVQEARRIDPSYDPAGTLAVHCLYKLGKHREALAAWQAAVREGRAEAAQQTTMYYAALSACKAGELEAGRALVRRAVYRYPASPLARQAREAIDEHE